MGLLARVRSWLGDAFGRAEPGAEEEAEPRLDPENVREVRTEADEDPAAKLNDVRERRAGDEGDEDR